jgi:hypothetical protein
MEPESIMFPFKSHLAQLPVVSAPVDDAALVVLPVKLRPTTPLTGTKVAAMVPPVAVRLPPGPIVNAADEAPPRIAENATEVPQAAHDGTPTELSVKHGFEVLLPARNVQTVPSQIATSPARTCGT